MKKTLLKLRSMFGKSFVHYFALFALIAARTNNYKCLFYFGEAKKTDNVTLENINLLLDKNR